MKAMILAAGLGTRMRPLTDDCPKPLLEVNGKPMIDYHLENLARIGIAEVVINVSYLGEKIESHCGNGSRYGLDIVYSREEQPLETAGGIAKALDLLGDEPFILVNGDIWSDYDFDLLALASLHGMLAHLVLVPNPEHHPEGDFAINAQGYVSDSGTQLMTYSGMALISPELFKHYQIFEGRLAPLLVMAMADEKITGEEHTGSWFDVGTPERLEEVSAFVKGMH